MKLIEALKRLRVVEKRMVATQSDIQKYSSYVNTEKPAFETEERQREEVRRLVQSNLDLAQEYLKLKRDISFTNLTVVIEIQGRSYTLNDLLVLKRKTGKMILETHQSLCRNAGEARLRNAPRYEGQNPQVVTLYQEDVRNQSLRATMDLLDQIDSRLEVINATTDLVEWKPQ